MVSLLDVSDPDFWQMRADEVRAKAVAMTDPIAKSKLLIAADRYDELVLLARKIAGDLHSPLSGDSSSSRSR